MFVISGEQMYEWWTESEKPLVQGRAFKYSTLQVRLKGKEQSSGGGLKEAWSLGTLRKARYEATLGNLDCPMLPLPYR